MNCRAWRATPPGSGGVAIIELQGDVEQVLEAIAPPGPWPVGELRLRRIAEIDTGLVVRLEESHAQLTPHGGPHVVELIARAIAATGAEWCMQEPPEAYPEAHDRIEATVLRAIARARSPLALHLLLAQPDRWRNDSSPLTDQERATSKRLNRLIDPPVVAVVGPPNAGKSTLLNVLLGREAAIVSAQAGTTRDHVGALIDIGGIVVQWIDTPGQRESDDPIEQEAIRRAIDATTHAELTVRLIAPDTPLPDAPHDGVDFLVVNKGDLKEAQELARTLQAHLIAATTGLGIETLLGRIRDALVPPEDLNHTGRWDLTTTSGTA